MLVENVYLQNESCALSLQPTYFKRCNIYFSKDKGSLFSVCTALLHFSVSILLSQYLQTSWHLECKLQTTLAICQRTNQIQEGFLVQHCIPSCNQFHLVTVNNNLSSRCRENTFFFNNLWLLTGLLTYVTGVLLKKNLPNPHCESSKRFSQSSCKRVSQEFHFLTK